MEKEEVLATRRKKLSKEEREIAEQCKKDRVRIANMVARKPELVKECCICGSKEANILHNKKNPYFIAFICDSCRVSEKNCEQAEQYRFDIRSKMHKNTLSVKNFTEQDVKTIIDNYLFDISNIGDYCKKVGISRHQFNKLLDRYADIFNFPTIKQVVLSHTNKVNSVKLSELANERNNF